MGVNIYSLPFRDRQGDRTTDIAANDFQELLNNNGHDEAYVKILDDLTGGKFSSGAWDDKMETWLSNALIGDLDYSRQLEMMKFDQAFNSAEAEKNRQFNLDVASNAYQRQAEDLRKAGYNPALVIGGGASSVPSSGVATSHHQGLNHIDAILPFLSGVVGSAFNLVANSMRNNTAMNIAQLNNKKVNKTPTWYQDIDNRGGGYIYSDLSGKNSTLKDYKKGEDDVLDWLFDLMVGK